MCIIFLIFYTYLLKIYKNLEQLTLSSRALAELKGYSNTIPNMHILINAVTINEAKDSSAIENIVTTHDDIYKVLTESGYKEENAKEVVDYRNAIWLGYEQIYISNTKIIFKQILFINYKVYSNLIVIK